MNTYTCVCGAKYRFAETAAGKRAQCKRCGESFVLAGGKNPGLEGTPTGRERPADVPATAPPFPLPEVIIEESESPPLWSPGAEQGYGRALFWSVLFPSSLHNLAAFLAIWAALSLFGFIPISRLGVFTFTIGLLFVLSVWFWYAAFRVGVIESAASGSYRLPDVELSGDVLADWLDPAIRWYGSWLVVFAPALVYAIAQGYRGVNVFSPSVQAYNNWQIGATVGPLGDPILLTLGVIGLFFWPLVNLVVIIGGFGYLWRIDRLLVTVGGALLPYLVTVAVVLASYIAIFASSFLINPPTRMIWGSMTTGGLGLMAARRILASGVELYAAIVAARTIGLYFRHYGRHFAWDWGQDER